MPVDEVVETVVEEALELELAGADDWLVELVWAALVCEAEFVVLTADVVATAVVVAATLVVPVEPVPDEIL